MKTKESFGNVSLQSYRNSSYDLHSVSDIIQTPDAKNEKVEIPQPRLKCRYIVTFIGFWNFFLITGYRMNMSVSIVAMVNNSAVTQRAKVQSESCPSLLPNMSVESETSSAYRQDGDFAWSPEVQGYIQGSYFLGYIITQIPTARLVERFGCKWFICGSAFVSSVCTFLVPSFAWISATALVVLQLIRGMSQGVIQPSMGVLVVNWFTRRERGLYYAFIQSGFSIGSFTSSVLSGILCASFGKWPSSFYAVGTIGIAVSLLILFFIHESPKDHPRISKAELDSILTGQETAMTKRRPNLPWREIFTSVPVYAVMFACFGQQWSGTQFLITHATFFGTILHYPIEENGLLVAIPFLIQFVMGQVAISLSKIMTQKNVARIDFTRKFWNFMSCLGFCVCTLGVYFAGCNKTLSVTFAILSIGFTGFGIAGCWVAVADMSPNFVGTLSGLCLAFSIISCVIIPLNVGYLTDERPTIEQWNKVFFISIGVVLASGIVFAIFGSAEVQPWNNVCKENDQETSKKETEDKTRF